MKHRRCGALVVLLTLVTGAQVGGRACGRDDCGESQSQEVHIILGLPALNGCWRDTTVHEMRFQEVQSSGVVPTLCGYLAIVCVAAAILFPGIGGAQQRQPQTQSDDGSGMQSRLKSEGYEYSSDIVHKAFSNAEAEIDEHYLSGLGSNATHRSSMTQTAVRTSSQDETGNPTSAVLLDSFGERRSGHGSATQATQEKNGVHVATTIVVEKERIRVLLSVSPSPLTAKDIQMKSSVRSEISRDVSTSKVLPLETGTAAADAVLTAVTEGTSRPRSSTNVRPPTAQQRGPKRTTRPPPPRLIPQRKEKLVKADPRVIHAFQQLQREGMGRKSTIGAKSWRARETKTGSDHDALIKEIETKSNYAKGVLNHVEIFGHRINDSITRIVAFNANSMAHLVEFVAGVELLLSELVDETAVLKHFDWPKKFGVMREAVALYQELEWLLESLCSWKPDPSRAISLQLKMIESFTNKMIARVDKMLQTEEQDLKKFKALGVPWTWGIVVRVRHAALHPLALYMNLVLEEEARVSDISESLDLLIGAIRYAFKVHAFSGGFTQSCSSLCETICLRKESMRLAIMEMEAKERPAHSSRRRCTW